jgi:hypothetical protein
MQDQTLKSRQWERRQIHRRMSVSMAYRTSPPPAISHDVSDIQREQGKD